MTKMEFDLTPEQIEKVEILKANDIDIGEAIDMLFEIKEKALIDIETFDDEKISLISKIKDEMYNVEEKSEVLDENYGDGEKTYELKAQEVKAKISWAKDIFNF
ncbi:MAG: hypothetical protein IKF11_00110 [Methanobrevibacter sp.]|nr:hypothetical protein [Methanobrevibacter sp.]